MFVTAIRKEVATKLQHLRMEFPDMYTFEVYTKSGEIYTRKLDLESPLSVSPCQKRRVRHSQQWTEQLFKGKNRK